MVTQRASTARPQHFLAMNFELHYRNMARIVPDDVIIASIGGAGQSLLGNILLELNLNYVNLATEELMPDGSCIPARDPHSATRRNRLAATHRRDDASAPRAYRCPRRFMKTHLPVEEFGAHVPTGVWLLVRDPRDAIYSWHRFHRGFAEREWERVPESFEDFLRQPFFIGMTPVDNWSYFYQGWLEQARRSRHRAVIHFEELKLDPATAVRRALNTIGVQPNEAELAEAIERSSYSAMRRHEDTIAAADPARPHERVMRRGKVDEWREWMTPQLSSFFAGKRLDAVARELGYDLGDRPQ